MGLAKIDPELSALGITGFRKTLEDIRDTAGKMAVTFGDMQGVNPIIDTAYEACVKFQKNYNSYLDGSTDPHMEEISKVADIADALDKVNLGEVSDITITEATSHIDTSMIL